MMMIKTMMRMNDVEGSKGEDVSESISGEDSEIVILYVTAVYLNDKKQVKKQIVKKNHFQVYPLNFLSLVAFVLHL